MTQDKLDPVVKTMIFPYTTPEAFQLFTGKISEWWPLGKFSASAEKHGKAETCAFEPRVGGRLFEREDNGEEHEWGRILEWNSPHSLRFTWHPGRTAETETEVAVAFVQEGDQARVELKHYAWEKLGEKAQMAREQYLTGWDFVFGKCFGDFALAESKKKVGA